MPLIMGSSKDKSQAAAIAYSIARKMKEKKMAEGGYVEKENYEPDTMDSPEMKEYYDGHDEEMDTEPHKYARGGGVPEVTSEIHPLAHLMHKEFMKKFSLGGMVSDDTHMDQMPDTDDDDEIAQGMEYPKDLEEEEQKDSAQDFIRSYMTSRAMRKR